MSMDKGPRALLVSEEGARRYSRRTFPAYRYVPGQTPHPTRDPRGHSYGIAEEALASFDVEAWASCTQYLYGVDLFNYCYWWEAHEAWEAVWKVVGRRTQTGLFFQGLIQIAVAALKLHMSFEDAAARLSSEGLSKIALVKGVYLGIDSVRFRADVQTYFSGKRESPLVIRLISV